MIASCFSSLLNSKMKLIAGPHTSPSSFSAPMSLVPLRWFVASRLTPTAISSWCLLFVLIRQGEGVYCVLAFVRSGRGGHVWCLLCCINSTRKSGGHEPPRWIRARVKETGNPKGTFGSHPLNSNTVFTWR
jgi:hypothetical protein